MYKYLLCWRYLRTRYIALASVISVMLGVATMIVVNSVMAGFSEKMRDRLHGVLADVVVDSYSLDGFYDHDEVMARIRDVAGKDVEALNATMETFALLKYKIGREWTTKEVQLIGVKPEERAKTGDFAEFLYTGRGHIDKSTGKIIEERLSPPSFGVTEELKMSASPYGQVLKNLPPEDNDAFTREIRRQMDEEAPDHGAILGWAIATYRPPGSSSDHFLVPPGTKVAILFPRSGNSREAGYDEFTTVGYFKSGMSEYDSHHVYVPIERLQAMRLLLEPGGKKRGAVNAIQIKVKPGVDIDNLANVLQTELEKFRPLSFKVSTWEQKQGALLSAVAIEQSILNILLFFIIAVAGFGILAIFFMIVVEKTRDIGIMKALGASTSGIRGIFLTYGLLLGIVGSSVGMAGGLLFVAYINEIEVLLSNVLGHKVFDDSIYYFNEIPTLVRPWTVFWIVMGALFIAATASVWPAQRAAKLHPVRALRSE